jgi:hypothetical protein
VRQIRILQASRDVADVGKIKNVIGFDEASADLRNGTGGTTLLARVEASGGEILQLKNALGMNNREPITTHPAERSDSTILSNEQDTDIGRYIINASSESLGGEARLAFAKEPIAPWKSAQTYNATTGVYEGTATTEVFGGTSIAGEWIELTFPGEVVLFKVVISPDQGDGSKTSPRDWALLGYKSDAWRSICEWTSTEPRHTWGTGTKYFPFENTLLSDKYQLVTTRVGNVDSGTGQDRLIIGELEFEAEAPYALSTLRKDLDIASEDIKLVIGFDS